MHSVSHSFEPADVTAIASALDRSRVDVIEVSHGDGLGGSSIQYGRAAASDAALVEAAVSAAPRAEVAILLLPGIGTLQNLIEAHSIGARVARVATHCTEADIAQQHISWAREKGMRTVGFLMMSHMVEPSELAAQAKLMEGYGAHVVYVVDSAGALVPTTAGERVWALQEAIDVEVGFHAHNNLGCAVGNTLGAVECGATWIDGSARGLGAGAGNSPTEVLAAAVKVAGHEVEADVFELMDAAEEVVAPRLSREPVIDRGALSLGYSGVYSSFLLHAERAAERYGVDMREILVELGKRRVVGGQEDMIIDVAAGLADARDREARSRTPARL
jgi:4-hydroxy-2-oxovalerate aldolase